MERLEGGLEDMSMYYSYYLGYVDENKKLFHWGPLTTRETSRNFLCIAIVPHIGSMMIFTD